MDAYKKIGLMISDRMTQSGLCCLLLVGSAAFLSSCGAPKPLFSSVYSDTKRMAAEQAKHDKEALDAEKTEADTNKKTDAQKEEADVALALASSKTERAKVEKDEISEKGTFAQKSKITEDKSQKIVALEEDEKPKKSKKALLAEAQKSRPTSDYQYTLPGVRPNGGIVIEMRSSMYDDTDIDANEEDSSPLYTLSSLGGFGRTLPNGLRTARPDVNVSCLKPKLVHILRTVEQRFRKPVIITSGYRSPSYNRRVNGARHSYHMSCSAADIQVVGVNKWQVAQFIRSLPGRGGVGTYCHPSIHVDVGPKRDWNWACRGKK